jgi:hypothetical protein
MYCQQLGVCECNLRSLLPAYDMTSQANVVAACRELCRLAFLTSRLQQSANVTPLWQVGMHTASRRTCLFVELPLLGAACTLTVNCWHVPIALEVCGTAVFVLMNVSAKVSCAALLLAGSSSSGFDPC